MPKTMKPVGSGMTVPWARMSTPRRSRPFVPRSGGVTGPEVCRRLKGVPELKPIPLDHRHAVERDVSHNIGLTIDALT